VLVPFELGDDDDPVLITCVEAVEELEVLERLVDVGAGDAGVVDV
jgi:hypothetical protein